VLLAVCQRQRMIAASPDYRTRHRDEQQYLPCAGGRRVGTTHRYLEDPRSDSLVLGWLRRAALDLLEVPVPPHGVSLYYREFGPLVLADGRTLASHRSPMVSVFLPRVRRGILWTVGEVHFLATPLRKLYPGLHKLNRRFGAWLRRFECVFDNGHCPRPEWAYLLEGSAQSYGPPILALPTGLEALNSGRYFVARDDSEFRLDAVCKQLRLRGVHCGDENGL
jgi:hypothetical protein